MPNTKDSAQVNKPDCSNHKKDLFGETDMKKVAEAIGDLNYESLSELLKNVSIKLRADGKNDFKAGRIEVGNRLMRASWYASETQDQIYEAWQISKPFMNPKNKPQ